MDQFKITLVFIHLAANLVWIGSILSVAWVLASPAGEARTRGEIAQLLYRRVAVPAFVISFSAAVLRLVLDLEYYFVLTKFMHGKLTLALGAIALHHVVGARAKRMAKGELADAGNVGALAVVLLLCAMGATFFVTFKF